MNEVGVLKKERVWRRICLRIRRVLPVLLPEAREVGRAEMESNRDSDCEFSFVACGNQAGCDEALDLVPVGDALADVITGTTARRCDCGFEAGELLSC